MSCPYKDVFGKPNTGVHAYRMFNIAVVDVMATLLLAFVIARWLRVSFVWTFVVLFIVGEWMHYMFCVDTTVIRWMKKVYKSLEP